MKTIKIITILLILSVALCVNAKKKPEYHRAEIKVSYNYHYHALRHDGEAVTNDHDYLLLANSDYSKYYNYNNEYLDSLNSTPQGRKLHDNLITIGIDKALKDGDYSAIPHYKGALYVFKSLQNRTTTVYDKYGLGEYGRYDEPFTEFVWTISDSTKNVIGYDCFMAETDYHGRHWTVWFTPEIPLQDGPWKLCGLPGLILEATDSTDQHSFIATGIENSNQEIYPIYEPRKYDKMKRIDMLKAYSDYQKNAGATSRILIMDTPDGSKVNMDAPTQRKANSQKIDFLETDYH